MKLFKKMLASVLIAGFISSKIFGMHDSHLSSVNLEIENYKVKYAFSTGSYWSGSARIKISPTGNFIATTLFADKSTAKIWDWNGKCITTLVAHSDAVKSIKFNSTETRVLTCCRKVVEIWDLHGNCLATVEAAPLEEIYLAKFSPKGDCLFTRYFFSDKVKVWDLQGNCLATLNDSESFWPLLSYIFPKHAEDLDSVAFSLDGNFIFTTSYDNTDNKIIVRRWNLNGKCLSTTTLETSLERNVAVWSVKFNFVNNLILIVFANGITKIWDLNGKYLATLAPQTGRISSAKFACLDRILTYDRANYVAKVWTFDGYCLTTWKDIWSVKCDPSGTRILSTDENGLYVWDLLGNCLSKLAGKKEIVCLTKFNSAGSCFITFSNNDKLFKLWTTAEMVS